MRAAATGDTTAEKAKARQDGIRWKLSQAGTQQIAVGATHHQNIQTMKRRSR